jgi:hypothetical protein
VTAGELGRHEGEIEPVSLHVDRVPERKSGNGAAKVGEDSAGPAVTLTQ